MGGAPFSPESPSPSLPKGRELIPAVFENVVWRSFPLGKAGMGPVVMMVSFLAFDALIKVKTVIV